MEWIILGILSALSFSMGNVFDKITVTKYFKSAKAYFYVSVFLFIIYLVFFLKTNLNGIPKNIILLTLFAGFIHMFAMFFYVKSISIEDISKISIILQLIPVMILILASIFLGEKLNNMQILSFFLILLGSLIISFNKLEPSKALPYILGVVLAISINNVMMKFAYNYINTYQGLLLNAIGHFFFPLLFIFDKKGKIETIKEIKNFKPTKLWIIIPSIFGLLGNLFSYSAYNTNGPISLISLLGSFSPVFVFFITVSLSRFFPHILKENIEKKELFRKIIAIFIMFVGFSFLYI